MATEQSDEWACSPRKNRSKGKHVPSHQLVSYARYQPNPKAVQRKYPTQKDIPIFSKERFVQANCRIFLAPESEHSFLSKDTDKIIDWAKVLRVDIVCPYGLEPPCSICLEETLVAPHITKCGHVFCWHCLLRFINTDSNSGRNRKRCPLCFEAICKADLRSARFQLVHPLKDSPSMHLCLVSRKCTLSTVVLSKQLREILSSNNSLLLLNEDENLPDEFTAGLQFVKVAILRRPDILWLQELDSLREKLAETDDLEVIPAIEEGIACLESRLKGIDLFISRNSYLESKSREESSNYVNCDSEIRDLLSSLFLSMDISKSHSSLSEDGMCRAESMGNGNHVINELATLESCATDSTEMKEFFFYQIFDGQHCYLHPFQFRCLLHEYKNTENLPLLLPNMKLLHLEEFLLTPTLRSRYKFLSHLSVSTPVTFVKVEMGHLLSGDTKAYFESGRKCRNSIRRPHFVRDQQQPSYAERTQDDVLPETVTQPYSGNSGNNYTGLTFSMLQNRSDSVHFKYVNSAINDIAYTSNGPIFTSNGPRFSDMVPDVNQTLVEDFPALVPSRSVCVSLPKNHAAKAWNICSLLRCRCSSAMECSSSGSQDLNAARAVVSLPEVESDYVASPRSKNTYSLMDFLQAEKGMQRKRSKHKKGNITK
ncbi:zinc finger, C3HC4 type (RING finger) domain-containing protein [Cardiosporidium cionae]|uniref:Zinc finger, C3HC4 type (RING finger) domain-containing protein n=1 Tax=Cardiosporidium cionae TaxID=476202 RepID=A0ABQ7JC87_9APIC|nr:zinc finger, C3HC4 type (RING finger) domain-containing protein [Cardiosporidium cionae]|eukprot:KAF8821627.1 zinc finger, C3HC4 type (RING finger) domain-containing protein [Cardiosporidium cionae]